MNQPGKPGFQTTEFWVSVVTALITLLNQSGVLGSLVLPVEAIASIVAIAAAYVLSRGITKSAEAKVHAAKLETKT